MIRIEVSDEMGHSRWVTANLVDVIGGGCGLALMTVLPSGSTVILRGNLTGRGVADHRKAGVRWCVRRTDGTFRAGLEFLDIPSNEQPLDLYEVMQLSPNADAETISRVYRMLAFRYHPDNAATGNAELFLRLTGANEILSDTEKRANYDRQHRGVSQPYVKKLEQNSMGTGARTNFEAIAAAYLGLSLETPHHDVCWEA